MSKTILDRATEPRKINPATLLFNFLRGAAFMVVQALAARELDGWLSIALWVNAGYNAVILLTLFFALVMIAAEASKRTEATR